MSVLSDAILNWASEICKKDLTCDSLRLEANYCSLLVKLLDIPNSTLLFEDVDAILRDRGIKPCNIDESTDQVLANHIFDVFMQMRLGKIRFEGLQGKEALFKWVLTCLNPFFGKFFSKPHSFQDSFFQTANWSPFLLMYHDFRLFSVHNVLSLSNIDSMAFTNNILQEQYEVNPIITPAFFDLVDFEHVLLLFVTELFYTFDKVRVTPTIAKFTDVAIKQALYKSISLRYDLELHSTSHLLGNRERMLEDNKYHLRSEYYSVSDGSESHWRAFLYYYNMMLVTSTALNKTPVAFVDFEDRFKKVFQMEDEIRDLQHQKNQGLTLAKKLYTEIYDGYQQKRLFLEASLNGYSVLNFRTVEEMEAAHKQLLAFKYDIITVETLWKMLQMLSIEMDNKFAIEYPSDYRTTYHEFIDTFSKSINTYFDDQNVDRFLNVKIDRVTLLITFCYYKLSTAHDISTLESAIADFEDLNGIVEDIMVDLVLGENDELESGGFSILEVRELWNDVKAAYNSKKEFLPRLRKITEDYELHKDELTALYTECDSFPEYEMLRCSNFDDFQSKLLVLQEWIEVFPSVISRIKSKYDEINELVDSIEGFYPVRQRLSELSDEAFIRLHRLNILNNVHIKQFNVLTDRFGALAQVQAHYNETQSDISGVLRYMESLSERVFECGEYTSVVDIEGFFFDKLTGLRSLLRSVYGILHQRIPLEEVVSSIENIKQLLLKMEVAFAEISYAKGSLHDASTAQLVKEIRETHLDEYETIARNSASVIFAISFSDSVDFSTVSLFIYHMSLINSIKGFLSEEGVELDISISTDSLMSLFDVLTCDSEWENALTCLPFTAQEECEKDMLVYTLEIARSVINVASESCSDISIVGLIERIRGRLIEAATAQDSLIEVQEEIQELDMLVESDPFTTRAQLLDTVINSAVDGKQCSEMTIAHLKDCGCTRTASAIRMLHALLLVDQLRRTEQTEVSHLKEDIIGLIQQGDLTTKSLQQPQAFYFDLSKSCEDMAILKPLIDFFGISINSTVVDVPDEEVEDPNIKEIIIETIIQSDPLLPAELKDFVMAVMGECSDAIEANDLLKHRTDGFLYSLRQKSEMQHKADGYSVIYTKLASFAEFVGETLEKYAEFETKIKLCGSLSSLSDVILHILGFYEDVLEQSTLCSDINALLLEYNLPKMVSYVDEVYVSLCHRIKRLTQMEAFTRTCVTVPLVCESFNITITSEEDVVTTTASLGGQIVALKTYMAKLKAVEYDSSLFFGLTRSLKAEILLGDCKSILKFIKTFTKQLNLFAVRYHTYILSQFDVEETEVCNEYITDVQVLRETVSKSESDLVEQEQKRKELTATRLDLVRSEDNVALAEVDDKIRSVTAEIVSLGSKISNSRTSITNIKRMALKDAMSLQQFASNLQSVMHNIVYCFTHSNTDDTIKTVEADIANNLAVFKVPKLLSHLSDEMTEMIDCVTSLFEHVRDALIVSNLLTIDATRTNDLVSASITEKIAIMEGGTEGDLTIKSVMEMARVNKLLNVYLGALFECVRSTVEKQQIEICEVTDVTMQSNGRDLMMSVKAQLVDIIKRFIKGSQHTMLATRDVMNVVTEIVKFGAELEPGEIDCPPFASLPSFLMSLDIDRVTFGILESVVVEINSHIIFVKEDEAENAMRKQERVSELKQFTIDAVCLLEWCQRSIDAAEHIVEFETVPLIRVQEELERIAQAKSVVDRLSNLAYSIILVEPQSESYVNIFSQLVFSQVNLLETIVTRLIRIAKLQEQIAAPIDVDVAFFQDVCLCDIESDTVDDVYASICVLETMFSGQLHDEGVSAFVNGLIGRLRARKASLVDIKETFDLKRAKQQKVREREVFIGAFSTVFVVWSAEFIASIDELTLEIEDCADGDTFVNCLLRGVGIIVRCSFLITFAKQQGFDAKHSLIQSTVGAIDSLTQRLLTTLYVLLEGSKENSLLLVDREIEFYNMLKDEIQNTIPLDYIQRLRQLVLPHNDVYPDFLGEIDDVVAEQEHLVQNECGRHRTIFDQALDVLRDVLVARAKKQFNIADDINVNTVVASAKEAMDKLSKNLEKLQEKQLSNTVFSETILTDLFSEIGLQCSYILDLNTETTKHIMEDGDSALVRMIDSQLKDFSTVIDENRGVIEIFAQQQTPMSAVLDGDIETVLHVLSLPEVSPTFEKGLLDLKHEICDSIMNINGIEIDYNTPNAAILCWDELSRLEEQLRECSSMIRCQESLVHDIHSTDSHFGIIKTIEVGVATLLNKVRKLNLESEMISLDDSFIQNNEVYQRVRYYSLACNNWVEDLHCYQGLLGTVVAEAFVEKITVHSGELLAYMRLINCGIDSSLMLDEVAVLPLQTCIVHQTLEPIYGNDNVLFTGSIIKRFIDELVHRFVNALEAVQPHEIEVQLGAAIRWLSTLEVGGSNPAPVRRSGIRFNLFIEDTMKSIANRLVTSVEFARDESFVQALNTVLTGFTERYSFVSGIVDPLLNKSFVSSDEFYKTYNGLTNFFNDEELELWFGPRCEKLNPKDVLKLFRNLYNSDDTNGPFLQ
ncbi:hypothetical protein PCE1_004088 [Barthelona sp. PCE]